MTERDCEILFYAFRYCLGRMSYAVQDFCDYAKAHLQEIDSKYLKLMASEIDEYSLGMECDEAAWRSLQMDIKEELERRKRVQHSKIEKILGPAKEKKRNKYIYTAVLQGNYGQGWEDLVEADVNNKEELKAFRENVMEYAENDPYPHRVIRRRVLNEEA